MELKSVLIYKFVIGWDYPSWAVPTDLKIESCRPLRG